jgi:multiple sugar transport system substrate-binding protein
MAGIKLKGITWGHSRGITPLLAASQRYNELHPEIEIKWSKRTLQDFADFPIEKLTRDFDLLVIDHPWVGCAAATQSVLPLNKYLSAEYLNDQLSNSIGHSHLSYQYSGDQWALAIDAAAPAASYRSDLFEKANQDLPSTWEDVIHLAETGQVAVPAIPVDLLMNFFSFCIIHGSEPFQSENEVTDTKTGVAAIATMKELYSRVNKKMFNANPIAVAEWMSNADEYWYCPLAYCYSNYSREGYAKNLLYYTDAVTINGKKLKTTLGGAGLSVSAYSQHKEIAIDFASMTASPEFQRTMYVQHGGQPGHRLAWMDDNANCLTNDFFSNLLLALDSSYVRPRYNGYLYFQDNAGLPLQKCLMENGSAENALNEMNKIYKQSLSLTKTKLTV